MGRVSRAMVMLALLLVASTLSLAAGQDTYHCPDGWYWHGWENHGHCYYFSMEQVSKTDAEILCASHGGWITEILYMGQNYWLKSMLIDKYTPNEKAPWGNQFWLGAVTKQHHDDHQNGNWLWTHSNKSVEFFDWGENEPNDFHSQNCLTYMEYRNVLAPWSRDYFWNDWDCNDDTAHYICTKDCADC